MRATGKEATLFFIADSIQLYWIQGIDYLRNFNCLIGFQQKYYPTYLGLMILPYYYFFQFLFIFYRYCKYFFSFFFLEIQIKFNLVIDYQHCKILLHHFTWYFRSSLCFAYSKMHYIFDGKFNLSLNDGQYLCW